MPQSPHFAVDRKADRSDPLRLSSVYNEKKHNRCCAYQHVYISESFVLVDVSVVKTVKRY